MLSERAQRQVERLLDEADEAIKQRQWREVRTCARDVLALDPDNADALTFLAAAERALAAAGGDEQPGGASSSSPGSGATSAERANQSQPTSFCDGRYEARRFLGEGGKKRVYLAHDTLLDRDVAFALIKTDGLDEVGRERIRREAQAMGRLGAHPHVVSVFDLGETDGQPFIVTELMGGGDVDDLILKASDHRVPLAEAIRIADEVCRGLEFAHGKQIVHRDLKPGNVWLTTDGTAKIGDFGLAVATDRARLTQPGLMVGTVAYMPPEQAMGGEVTSRSDLYSLGAMLYELVTGRPPFVGDESVAIITQHLNTPPVAPSWHRPDCPPGLEALLLRLLEKDPDKRPRSVEEVRQALASLDFSTSPADPGISPTAAAENPLYRRTFVGREHELRQLQAVFDGAVSGRGALVMIVGEPGIGKTALCEQLATHATIRGGKALVGHCYEEGSLTLPYLPFVEAIRSYVLAREPESLRHELGSGAMDVARIVSEIREKLALSSGPSPNLGGGVGVGATDSEDDRWRLYQAVTGLLRNAATVQPLLVVLEDLHWADRGSLDYLVHLSRNLVGARLLVVGTYRDVEVDRAHPLSAVLAELRRTESFARIPLRGLTPDEVHRMLNSLTAQEVRWSLAEAVHRQTEGNPLFIQEVLRYLVEEGLITREGGRWRRTGEAPPEMGIPEGLRDVIGKRLSRLSPECNRALGIAAVIGRDFGLATLQRVAGIDEEPLIAALEEAVRVGVVEERTRPGQILYRFAHAFFRQTLYEEMLAPRRLRLHQQVARALEEEYRARPDEHAAELAEHFAQSTDRADLEKAVAYSRMAARRAGAVYAYGEAARLLDQALGVQEVVDPDDRRTRCELLLGLAEALGPAGEPLRVVEEVGEEAFVLADALGDGPLASRACELAFDCLSRYGGITSRGGATGRRWADRAQHHSAPGTAARVYAELGLGDAAYLDQERGQVSLAEAWAHYRRALEEARHLGDRQALFQCGMHVLVGGAVSQWDELLDLARELAALPREGVSAVTLGPVVDSCGSYLLALGDRSGAEALWRESEQLAARTRDPYLAARPARNEMIAATLDGDLEGALEAGARGVALAEEAGSARGVQAEALLCLPARLYLGRAQEALDRLRRLPQVEEREFSNTRLRAGVCLGHLGHDAEAGEVLRGYLGQLGGAPGPETAVHLLHVALELAVVLQDRGAVALLSPVLAPLGGLLSTRGRDLACIGRHLGDAAALLGNREAAKTYYEQGLAVCQRARFRPEIALIRLGLAELLLDEAISYQQSAVSHLPSAESQSPTPSPQPPREAQAHLDFAIDEFRAMKMHPSLERALRHKGLLRA